MKTCENCGKEFTPVRGSRQRFCDPACRRRYDLANITGHARDCNTCGDTVIVDDDADAHIQSLAWANHRRFCVQKVPTTPRGNRKMNRPPASELANHADRHIAKAAQKVLDAAANLDRVYDEYAGKAALRAKQAELEAELAAVKAQLRGGTGKPKPAVDSKAVRAWARDNGYAVNPAGIIPKTIVEAYVEATAA